MRVFCGGIATETNTFGPIPTSLEDFTTVRKGDSQLDFSTPPEVVNHIEGLGHEVVVGLSAFAQPSGTTTVAAYETLLNELLDNIRDAGSLDVLLLMMHGAMVVHGIDDAEVDMTRRIREIVGPDVKIGVELDLHCHIDQRLLDLADVIVIYKEYPHVDIVERHIEMADLVLDAAAGKTKPTMALFDCKMVGLCSTFREPMRSFVNSMQAMEKEEGVLSLSLGHGFPYGDVIHAGAKMLVITDGNPEQAASLAAQFGRGYYDIREQALMNGLSLEEAMTQAVASTKRPTVVADQADNSGGGAPADSTFALKWLLDNKVSNVGVANLYDPEVVKIAKAAGEGAVMNFRLGGKTGVSSGDPLDVVAAIVKIEDDYMHEFPQQNAVGMAIPLGNTVCLKIDGVYVMVSSLRSQCFTPKIWDDFGLPSKGFDILVPKSTNHFMSGHAEMAGEVIYMSAQGALVGDVTMLDYKVMPAADKYPWNPAPLG